MKKIELLLKFNVFIRLLAWISVYIILILAVNNFWLQLLVIIYGMLLIELLMEITKEVLEQEKMFDQVSKVNVKRR